MLDTRNVQDVDFGFPIQLEDASEFSLSVDCLDVSEVLTLHEVVSDTDVTFVIQNLHKTSFGFVDNFNLDFRDGGSLRSFRGPGHVFLRWRSVAARF